MSSKSWRILDTGKADAEKNMSIDAALLQSLSENPILHFYDWIKDSGTYGHFIDPKKFFKEEGVSKRGLSLAKRPTGGGIVFHIRDFAFSVLIPAECSYCSTNTLDNYAFVNRRITEAIKSFLGKSIPSILLPEEKISSHGLSNHFCMAKPTKFDVMLEGKKISGGAQRRTKNGFLHQGTISLLLPDEEFIIDILKEGKMIFESMKAHTYLLMGTSGTSHELEKVRNELRSHLVNAFTR